MASDVQSLLTKSYVASAAVNKYRFVTVATSTMKVAQTGAKAMATGVALQSGAADTDVISVGLLGIFPLEAGEAIAAGLGVSSGAAGVAMKSTNDAPILGIALQDIASSEVGAVLVIPVKALAIAS